MIEIRLGGKGGDGAALAVILVAAAENDGVVVDGGVAVDGAVVDHAVVDRAVVGDESLHAELTAFVADVEHSGAAGIVHTLARPSRVPAAVLVVGVGAGDESGWRAAGAGLVRAAATRWTGVEMRLPDDTAAEALTALAEGASLGSYRYRLGAEPDATRRLARLTIATLLTRQAAEAALAKAGAVTDAVVLARDLTNAPSGQKSPAWFADRIDAAATRRPGIRLKVLERAELEQAGFGGILAVGSGSPRPPRLVELGWRPSTPRGSARPMHVVLVGKGITFDTGGISIKTLDGMRLMRKDMAGAAAVCATVLAAADLKLPVRVTALAPLADNLVSGTAYRPGDVIRHYGGITTEVQNTDAEGRLVLADALAYAVRRLGADVILDLATLTGAANVALGKRTAAVLTPNDDLARALLAAGDDVGERMWRLPLADDYAAGLASDVADLTNSPVGGAGAITAALFLREFVGSARDRWAHIDMSAPSWSDSNDGILSKGATGWGVRAMLHWLSGLEAVTPSSHRAGRRPH